MSVELAIAYEHLRFRALQRLAGYLHPYRWAAEDVFHDVCLEVLERYDTSRPVTHLINRLLKPRAFNELRSVRHTVPLDERETPGTWDAERRLETRNEAKKAASVLTQTELDLMLREWSRQPPRVTAIKIREAKRKALRAILSGNAEGHGYHSSART